MKTLFNLSLGLGLSTSNSSSSFNTSLSLGPCTTSETCRRRDPLLNKAAAGAALVDDDFSELASSQSAASCLSLGSCKRERETIIINNSNSNSNNNNIEGRNILNYRGNDEEEDGGGGGGSFRKKLRLTKHQSALLEHSFTTHTTLNPKQKQALARELNLRPRQVEVWFQNRRARTKLKQTEMDCEVLKKCCEALRGEKRSLMKELEELKAMKLGQHLHMRFPAATLTMCPSCERLHNNNNNNNNNTTLLPTKQLFSLPKPNLPLFPHFPNSSPACFI